ncbi:MAG: LCP family protein, partial [Actinomycetota bacterium]
DISINHYVQLDFLAFRDVVEELDGVGMWFHYPSRDLETGFNAFDAGCTVLDGANALGFVRSRTYEEFIDGQWVIDRTAPDLDRIERQQQFVIAALDRAIARGARNPTSLAALIDAAAESVVLDQGLTPAELIDLAEAFTDFSSETLQTFSPEVEVVIYERDGSEKLRLVEDLDAEMFQIFRGVEDAVSLGDIRFSVAGTDPDVVVSDTELFRSLGFSVGTERILAEVAPDSVIVYPTGGRSAAETLARYVIPIPGLIEDPASAEMALVLGSNHDSVSFFFPQDVDETLAGIAAVGEVAIPSLVTSTSTTEAATTTSAPAATDGTSTTVPESTTTAPSSTIPTSSTTTAPSTTTTAPTTTVVPAPTTTVVSLLPGRPPDGESCG